MDTEKQEEYYNWYNVYRSEHLYFWSLTINLDILLKKLISTWFIFFFWFQFSVFCLQIINTSKLFIYLTLSFTYYQNSFSSRSLSPFLPYFSSYIFYHFYFSFKKILSKCPNTSISVKLLLYQDLTKTMPKTDHRCLFCARRFTRKITESF